MPMMMMMMMMMMRNFRSSNSVKTKDCKSIFRSDQTEEKVFLCGLPGQTEPCKPKQKVPKEKVRKFAHLSLRLHFVT